MEFATTDIPGLLVFEPKVFGDARGYFYESYNRDTFRDADVDCEFVQDNISRSRYGVVRGLHYQLEPRAQAKLVRVLEGRVLDVVVDLRDGSPTFKKTFSIILDADTKNQLFIPRGFGHGFAVLSEWAEFFYKCDNYYSPADEAGIRYDDPELGIDWMLSAQDVVLSGKDGALPPLADARMNFTFA